MEYTAAVKTDYVYTGLLTSMVIGIIMFVLAILMTIFCKGSFINNPSKWGSGWPNASGCEKTEFVLFWLGLAIFISSLITVVSLYG